LVFLRLLRNFWLLNETVKTLDAHRQLVWHTKAILCLDCLRVIADDNPLTSDSDGSLTVVGLAADSAMLAEQNLIAPFHHA